MTFAAAVATPKAMVVEIFVYLSVSQGSYHVRCPLAKYLATVQFPTDGVMRSARAAALMRISEYQEIPDRIEFRVIWKDKP